MRAEMLIDLMHDALHTIQRDMTQLAEAALDDAIKRPGDYYALFTGGMQIANHAIGLRDKINAMVAALEPLAVEHIAAHAVADQEHGRPVH